MFQQHYSDRNIGEITAIKLLEKGKTSNEDPTDSQGVVVNVNCGCCVQYRDRGKKHSEAHMSLQKLADETVSYKVFPDKMVVKSSISNLIQIIAHYRCMTMAIYCDKS